MPTLTSASAAAQPAVSTRPIETIRVGERVVTSRAAAHDASDSPPTQVDPATWRRLRLRGVQTLADGTPDIVEVETLQPPEWVKEHGALVGAEVPLPVGLADMAIPEELTGEVLANEPCPAIRSGPGRVVLTTINHLCGDVWRVTFAGERDRRESVQCSGVHRIWSESRHDWVFARDLRPGERLRGVVNGTLKVAAVEPVPGLQRVYNMGVEGEHVYHVSTLGALVHNPGPTSGPVVDPRTGEAVGRLIVDSKGNTMIEPAGGRTVAAGKGGIDTHTTYANGSNYQRLNPLGHAKNPTPHAHAHAPGTGPGMKGQGPSLDAHGNVVPFNSADAHFPIH